MPTREEEPWYTDAALLGEPDGCRYELTPDWLYILANDEPPYEITGKYLFFSPDPARLLHLAVAEIQAHSFHAAKINSELAGSDYVLCLYYADDSRRGELRGRYPKQLEPGLRYRFWKSDADTFAGKYSQEYRRAAAEKRRSLLGEA